MREDEPKVSIIIPCQNGAKWLVDCCSTVQSQSVTSWEAIIVEDGSGDDSVDQANRIVKNDNRFRLIRSRRTRKDPSGPWLARNRGMEEAVGRWIAFLDVDDLWHPLKLERQLQLLEEERATLCVCAYYRFRDKDGMVSGLRIPPEMISPYDLNAINPIPMSSAIVQKCLLRGIQFRGVSHEDHDLWQRLMHERDVCYTRLHEPLMAYRLHRNNLTHGVANRFRMKWRSQKERNAPPLRGLFQAIHKQIKDEIQDLHWKAKKYRIQEFGFLEPISVRSPD